MRLFDRKPHLARAHRAPKRAPHLPAEAPQRVQRKPDISSPGDAHEREADDVAESVMRMGEPGAIGSAPLRDYFEPRFEHGFEPVRVHAQASEAGGREAPCGIEETLRSAGQPLDGATRSFFEPRFGRSFADVRVHSDATAAASAAAIDADAYTLGKHLVFGAGRFDPTSHDGRRLIAHELTHVTQQAGTGGRAMVQRRKGKKPSAADAPKLEVSKSKNGAPCACVVFVHNDERNARKTAKLMHEHCAYNLAMVGPDTGAREVKIPAGGMEDPNGLFPREVAEQCLKDEAACADFVAKKATTTDPAEIDQVVKQRFFLAVKDCSNSFALPVIALHNNAVDDTAGYRAEKDTAGVADLKLDVDKRTKATGADQIEKMKKLLKDKFGDKVMTDMVETPKKTSIFRWCRADDLSRCHIGDPDHPDNVVWVTNEKDFAKLAKTDVNVVFQSEIPTAAKSESKGDLSTLFLILQDIFTKDIVTLAGAMRQSVSADADAVKALFAKIEELRKFNDLTPQAEEALIHQIIALLLGMLKTITDFVLAGLAKSQQIENLHFINIETREKVWGSLTDAERIENYEFIVTVLKSMGLHCCGNDSGAAETKIKSGLKGKEGN